MSNKTFKGSLRDGAEVTIRLSTNNGLRGYKIVKFQVMAEKPGTTIQESIIRIQSRSGISPTNTINFDDPNLLACAVLQAHDSSAYQFTEDVIFDNKTVNQDIYVTHIDVDGSARINYYIELEQVKLDINEATVATLKDMRGRE